MAWTAAWMKRGRAGLFVFAFFLFAVEGHLAGKGARIFNTYLLGYPAPL